MRLADKGLHTQDIDLGGFDAETDHGLRNHFVRTPILQRLLERNKYLVLGRKGSGKSALFREFPRIAEEHDGSMVISLTPDAYAWGALRDYKEQGLSGENAHANAWKLTLAVEMAARLTRPETSWTDAAFLPAKTLATFLRANFQDGSDLRVAHSLYKGVESFDVGAFGFNLGLTRGRTEAIGARITPAVADAILARVSMLLREARVIVQLDRLDDAWQGKVEDKSLIVGLLKAVKDINNTFAGGGISSKIIVFLRSDIYDSLSFDDSDKHRQGEERIAWAADGLRDLLDARLPPDVTVDDLFEPGAMRGGRAPFDYILRRTFYRPREVLQYLQLAIDAAGDDEEQICKKDVSAAEAQFSAWKVADLKQEYDKAVPELRQLIDALQQLTTPLESVDALESALAERVPELVALHGARWCSSQLWEASAIGARLNGTEAVRFTSLDPGFSMPSDGVVYIHFGLMNGLNVKDGRAGRGTRA